MVVRTGSSSSTTRRPTASTGVEEPAGGTGGRGGREWEVDSPYGGEGRAVKRGRGEPSSTNSTSTRAGITPAEWPRSSSRRTAARPLDRKSTRLNSSHGY